MVKFMSKLFENIKKLTFFGEKDILYNKYLLYFILFISLTDLMYYAVEKKYIFIFIFFIIGYLTYFFSKNMIVIMCISIAFTNILSMNYSKRNISEGLTTSDSLDLDIDDDNNDDNYDDDNNDDNYDDDNNEDDDNDNDEENEVEPTLQSISKRKKPTLKSISNSNPNMKPIVKSMPNSKPTMKPNGTSTNGLDELDIQTSKLMDTQSTLIQNMKTLEPMLSKAENFLNQFQQPMQ